MARSKVAKVVMKESKRFKPHMNQALGKYYHTKDDYLRDMKKGGFEPYTGEAKPRERQKPDTSGTNSVLRAIRDCSHRDGSFTPSGNLRAELVRRGVLMTKESVQAYRNKVENFTR